MNPLETHVAALPAHSLFYDVPAGDIERLMAASRPLGMRAGQHVFSEGQASETVYLLLNGSVKLYHVQSDDSAVVLTICGVGEVLGDADVMHSLTYACSALALEAVTLRSMPRDACLHCLQTMPTLTFNLARHALGRLREQSEQLHALASNDIPGRLAAQLLRFADRYATPDANGSITIPLPLAQRDLAGMVGASRSRVNETMTSWQRSGYLSMGTMGKKLRITLHNPEALRRRCRA